MEILLPIQILFFLSVLIMSFNLDNFPDTNSFPYLDPFPLQVIFFIQILSPFIDHIYPLTFPCHSPNRHFYTGDKLPHSLVEGICEAALPFTVLLLCRKRDCIALRIFKY